MQQSDGKVCQHNMSMLCYHVTVAQVLLVNIYLLSNIDI